MDQNRMRSDDDMPNRSSNMEQAEGSRDNVRNSGNDLGSASDRAMFSDRMDESDSQSSSEDSANSSERGVGSTGERNSSSGGGITNRGRDIEQAEQDRLPDRGRSQSER
jgi:hypothetical protein